MAVDLRQVNKAAGEQASKLVVVTIRRPSSNKATKQAEQALNYALKGQPLWANPVRGHRLRPAPHTRLHTACSPSCTAELGDVAPCSMFNTDQRSLLGVEHAAAMAGQYIFHVIAPRGSTSRGGCA